MSIFDEPAVKPITPVGERYWDGIDLISTPPTLDDITYLHILFAHTGMPYKEVEFGKPYRRQNGKVWLGLTPGYLMNPKTNKLELMGLPYGPLPRLLMLYICHEAKRWNSPLIDMNRSMSSFLKQDLLSKSSGGGPRGALTSLKRQMDRLAATPITIGVSYTRANGKGAVSTIKPTPAIIEYKVWDEDSLKDRPMWKTEIQMSDKFFDGVVQQSIPLDSRAIHGLKSSAMCLDIYFNLAQRLYRIRAGAVERPTWTQLWGQFGQDYGELKRFKFAFIENLRRVLKFYPDANIGEWENGLEFRKSPPPIPVVMSARQQRAQQAFDFALRERKSGPDPMVGVWRGDK